MIDTHVSQRLVPSAHATIIIAVAIPATIPISAASQMI
jgi:hypothetical protein